MYTWNQGRSTKAKSVDRALSCILGVAKRDVFWGLPNMYPESYDCGLPVQVDKTGETESEAEFQERMRSMMTSSFSFLGVILGSRLGLFELPSNGSWCIGIKG